MPILRRISHRINANGHRDQLPSNSIRAADLGRRDKIMHPVDRAEQGRFAAAGRADDGGDTVARRNQARPAFTAWLVPKWTFIFSSCYFCVHGSSGIMFLTSLRIFLLSAEQPCPQIQGKHDDHQHQRSCPGKFVPVFVGGDGKAEDLQRQRGNRFSQFSAPELVAQGGEKQRRRLSGDSGNRQQDAGDNPFAWRFSA